MEVLMNEIRKMSDQQIYTALEIAAYMSPDHPESVSWNEWVDALYAELLTRGISLY